jgi:hypothetical protein
MLKPFINLDCVKTSPYPSSVVPPGVVLIDRLTPVSEEYDIKGFYDPETGELHIQQIVKQHK